MALLFTRSRRWVDPEGGEKSSPAGRLPGRRRSATLPAMITDEDLSARARALGAAIEPFTGQVYFSPECHRAYEALGFSPEPGGDGRGGDARRRRPTSAAAARCWGRCPGEVVAAAFGVFNPAVVVPSVAMGWALASRRDDVRGADRGRGRSAHADPRRRARRPRPARPSSCSGRTNRCARRAGRSTPGSSGWVCPATPVGDAWRLADRLREFRGDAHIAAWSSEGFDATEIGLLTELYWGLPMRTYIRTRAWSDADLDAAEARLEDRGLVAGGAMTDDGRAAREHVEVVTDRLCRPIVDALGDDFDELVGILGGWSRARPGRRRLSRVRAARPRPCRQRSVGELAPCTPATRR